MKKLCVFILLTLVRTNKAEDREIGLVRELWSDVGGDSLQSLLSDVRFPHKPNVQSFIRNFETPESDASDEKNIAQRIKGYFVAPVRGKYKFFSSCDGSCEVFLSLDGTEGENNRIISQQRSTKRNQFNLYPEQQSKSITLEGGNPYYIEALNKQGTGIEHLSVGVELPNGRRFFPIPSDLLKTHKNEDGNENADVRGFAGKQNKHVPVLDLEGKKFNDKDAIEPGINIFQGNPQLHGGKVSKPQLESSEMKEGNNKFVQGETTSMKSASRESKKLSVAKLQHYKVMPANEKNIGMITRNKPQATIVNRKSESRQINPTVRQGIGMDLGRVGIINNPDGIHNPFHMEHPVIDPASLSVLGTQETAAGSKEVATPLRQTGKVALIPAILHKTDPHYDHETGRFTPGESHVEPLIPAHNTAQHFPVVDHGIGGGGMDHGFAMMEPTHAIDMDHGGGAGFQPELHAPMEDYHHEGHVPLVVHPHIDQAPLAPTPKKKPDVIKVEFIPEETGIKVAGRTMPESKKAGTVRVQFIPGENSVVQDSPVHNVEPVQQQQQQQQQLLTQVMTRNPQSRSSTSSSETNIPTNILTSKLKDKLEGREQREPEQALIHPQSNPAEILTSSSSANLQGNSLQGSAPENSISSSSSKSINGYEAHPMLPTMGRSSTEDGKQVMDRTVETPLASANPTEEKIDPPFTALGQKYPEAVPSEEKEALISETKSPGGQERVFFRGGMPSQATSAGVATNMNQPDPNPTNYAPSDYNPSNGQGISPVAGQLVNSIQDKSLSPEEALQMMNDFVSGNQDMNKAAKNIAGMLTQIRHQRHPITDIDSMDTAGMHPPADVAIPENDDSHKFIQGSNDLNPDLQTGYTNPTMSKNIDNIFPNQEFERTQQSASQSHESAIPMEYQHSEPEPAEYEHNTLPPMDFEASQRDEPHRPQEMQNDGLPAQQNRDAMSRLNQLSPYGPPPPVDVYEGEGGNKFIGSSEDRPSQHSTHSSHDSMVIEPFRGQDDGFANPLMNAGIQMHKMIPDIPRGDNIRNYLDKIDPHEVPGVSDPSSRFTSLHDTWSNRHEMETDVQSNLEERSSARPQVDVTSTSRGFDANSIPSNLASIKSPPISENIGDSPLAMFGGNEATTLGYNTDSTFSRKFNTPHYIRRAQPQITGSTNVPKKPITQTGQKKHSVLAEMYADSVFPEDNMDIKSLQGSLQGRTLSNYNTKDLLGITDSKEDIPHHNINEIKASFPLEGLITGGYSFRSRVPSPPSQKLTKKNKKRNKIKKKKKGSIKKSAQRRVRRSLKEDLPSATKDLKSKRIYSYIKETVMKNVPSINNVTLERKDELSQRKDTTSQQPGIFTSTKTMEIIPRKTDWADINPVVNKDISRAQQSVESANHMTGQESSTLAEKPSKAPTAAIDSQERASLRRLVGELKDVLHKLKDRTPVIAQVRDEKPVADEFPELGEKSLTEDDILRYEAVTKGDIINAFASVKNMSKNKMRRPHSMDIERYTQNVYDPGYAGYVGDFKRTIPP